MATCTAAGAKQIVTSVGLTRVHREFRIYRPHHTTFDLFRGWRRASRHNECYADHFEVRFCGACHKTLRKGWCVSLIIGCAMNEVKSPQRKIRRKRQLDRPNLQEIGGVPRG